MALGNSSFKLNLTSRVYGMKSDELKVICYLSDIERSFADIILPRRFIFYFTVYTPRNQYIVLENDCAPF